MEYIRIKVFQLFGIDIGKAMIKIKGEIYEQLDLLVLANFRAYKRILRILDGFGCTFWKKNGQDIPTNFAFAQNNNYVVRYQREIIREGDEEMLLLFAKKKDSELKSGGKDRVKKSLDNAKIRKVGNLSKKAIERLKKLADETLADRLRLPSKIRNKGKGAVCIIEFGDKIYEGISIKGLARGVYREGMHPLLDDWIRTKDKIQRASELGYNVQHGKCAEVDALDKLLWDIDPRGEFSSLESIKDLLNFKAVSKALDTHKDELIHKGYKEACRSCNPMLEDFGILEDINKTF